MPENTAEKNISNLALNFDLDTKKTKEVFGSRGTSPAYAMIKDFLEAHGFEHRQYSGYRTSKPMRQAEAYEIVKNMYQEFSWLSDCVQRMDLTKIDRLYDLHEIILNERKESVLDRNKEQIPSLSDRAFVAKDAAQGRDFSDQTPNHYHDQNR